MLKFRRGVLLTAGRKHRSFVSPAGAIRAAVVNSESLHGFSVEETLNDGSLGGTIYDGTYHRFCINIDFIRIRFQYDTWINECTRGNAIRRHG